MIRPNAAELERRVTIVAVSTYAADSVHESEVAEFVFLIGHRVYLFSDSAVRLHGRDKVLKPQNSTIV